MSLKVNPFTCFEQLDKKGYLLAKPNKTLQEHSIEVAQISKIITLNTYLHSDLNQYREKIKQLIVLSAYIHDAGKADKRWQEYIRNKVDKSIIPHPLFSLPIAKKYLIENFNEENSQAKELFINLALFSIANHHSPFTNDKYEGYEDWKADYLFNYSNYEIPYRIFSEVKDQIINKMDKGIRYLYVVMNGIISLADWISSAEQIDYKRFDQDFLNDRLDTYFKIELKSSPYFYQREAQGITEDIFIQLPTGTGKTETSLFWLTSQKTNKVFYTLPTVTTVEAMRRRFENIFGKEGKEEISFSHHLLDISLMEEERLTEAELFVQKHLLKPTAVTTIDRILLSLMNYRRFTVSEIMLNNATLIIDEIHSYSPFTFSLIVEALRYLKEYHNVRLCIMSATMPEVIKNAFIKLNRKGTNKIRSLISDKEVKKIYNEKRRTKIAKFYPNRLILEGVDDIIKSIKKYKKILLVVNTVSRAQTLFDMVKKGTDKNTNIVLFHSRFTYGDRNKKQKEIDKINRLRQKIVFIATQIVEVSLDIDFDILFTEIAPIDSIIQRAGRINRRGKKSLCDIYIFDVEDEEKGYLPYKRKQIEESRHIISTAKVKSEADYSEMNEIFYAKIKDYYQFELQENKLDDFLEQIYEKGGIDKALSTRDGFLTIPVVPKCFKKRVEEIQKEIGRINRDLSMTKSTKERELLRNEKLNLTANLTKYFVPISFYNAKTTLLKETGRIPFVDLEYSFEKGIVKAERDIVII